MSSTIRMKKAVKKRLASFGKKEDTYEDIVVRLMDDKELCIKNHEVPE